MTLHNGEVTGVKYDSVVGGIFLKYKTEESHEWLFLKDNRWLEGCKMSPAVKNTLDFWQEKELKLWRR